MTPETDIYIGAGETPVYLLQKLANRHGLIAGATGTGKTVSLQILAEQFSQAGVPVFMADVKGDISGISQSGTPKPALDKRAQDISLDDYSYFSSPTVFWDLFGDQGHPIRTTISDMGPLLLARLLELNDTQEGVLNIAFKLADDEGLLLLDLKDLRSMLNFVAENTKSISAEYGNVSTASVGAIQRRLLVLEQQGGEHFFGEPALELESLMEIDDQGRGYVSVLAADALMQAPKLYSVFLLWLLAELFEELPEVGDLAKPRLVFFFDEAHLLFDDAPKALADKVEQVVRLIRSKGIGVYFVSQNPLDIPDEILGQLGNRIQHGLRAFTPRDQKAVRAAAQTFRPNPSIDTERAITELGVGEALVSTLEAKGTPSVVQRVLIRPPASRMGPVTPDERRFVIEESPVKGRYDKLIDRESAHEILQARAETEPSAAAKRGETEVRRTQPRSSSRRSGRQSVMEAMVKSVARSIGSGIGRQIVRGVLGSLLRGR